MRETELGSGLLLRPYRIEDADAIHEAVEANRLRLIPTMPWAPYSTDVVASRAFITASARQEEEGIAIQRGLFSGLQFAGGVGASLEPINRVADIGYWIDEEWEGRGVVTEAVEALIDHLIDEERIHRFVIRAAVGNTRSRALAERLGFVFEGVLRQSLVLDDVPTDAAIYSLLAPEWRARRDPGA